VLSKQLTQDRPHSKIAACSTALGILRGKELCVEILLLKHGFVGIARFAEGLQGVLVEIGHRYPSCQLNVQNPELVVTIQSPKASAKANANLAINMDLGSTTICYTHPISEHRSITQ
jgi:hypothetical protein